MQNKIGIVVLNYNNFSDTQETIQSLLKCIDATKHVLLVVDNASTDTSWNDLKLANSVSAKELSVHNTNTQLLDSMPVVHLIQSNENKGYAYGNNCGIKQCLLDQSITHVWVLNNDVALDKNCLVHINQTVTNAIPNVGIWGTLLAYYYHRSHLQCVAANYYPFIAKTTLRLSNFPVQKVTASLIEMHRKKADFFIGASLIFSRKILSEVGLLNEQFFLYAEELDYFLRAKKAGFEKQIIHDAIVYHKEGGTTKLNGDKKKTANTFIEFHNGRSKLIYTKLYYKQYYWLVYFVVVANLFWVFRNKPIKAINLVKCIYKDTYQMN